MKLFATLILLVVALMGLAHGRGCRNSTDTDANSTATDDSNFNRDFRGRGGFNGLSGSFARGPGGPPGFARGPGGPPRFARGPGGPPF